MKFAHVEMLFLVWALPVLLLAFLYGWRRRRRILHAWAHTGAAAHLASRGLAARRRAKAVLVLAAAGLMVAALAGPQYGFQWQEIERQGVDIIIALDCSRSMLAQDIQPDRLARAKREIYDLLTMLQGDRIGLVAFSGTAFLQCPLTIDYSAFYLFLDVLTPDYLPVGGSDLAAALQTAREAFDPEGEAEKAVILITDGENTGRQDPMAAARAAREAGIRLFCIGVGSDDGVPVPAGAGGFQKDSAGQIVLSRLDESLLTRMALATGGSYARSVAGDMDLDTIYRRQIRSKMEAATVESGRKQVWSDRFQWPLALAVLLLVATRWIPPVSRPLATLILAAALCTAPHTAKADPLREGSDAYGQGDYPRALQQFIKGQVEQPDRPEVLYNLGNAYYKTGDFQAAFDNYSQALSRAPDELKGRLHYNMGNSAFRMGHMDAAVENYEAALQIDPGDRQARENLEFVRKQMQKQPPQQSSDQQQQGESAKDRQPDQAKGAGAPPRDPSGKRQDQSGPKPDSDQGQAPRFESEMNPEEQQAQAQPPSGEQPQPAAGEPPRGGIERHGTEPPSAASRMLNRLKDQPGRALMPDYQKRRVDKDW